MKQLIAGIVIILVLGIGAFLYRYVMTHPTVGGATTTPPVACTLEAKICPDGTSVGRAGPNCEFAACPYPNVSIDALGIAFAAPAGYSANANALGQDETLRAVFDKPSKGDVPHSIVIRDYPIEAGKTADATVLAHTMYESSGMMAASMSELAKKVIGSKTFYCVTLERFEGQVHTACYLERANDVLRFEVLEKDVDWTNPNLVIDQLPEHKAFFTMLGTLQAR